MAPETSTPDWGARGARLLSLELSLYPTASAEAWAALFESSKLTSANRAQGREGRSTLSFLVLPPEPTGYFLSGVAHPMRDDPTTAHWSLEFRTLPREPPPDDVKAMSEALGGVEGFLRRLADGWPAPPRPAVEIVSVGYGLDAAKWTGIQGFAESVALNTAPPLRLDMVGWHVEPPSGPIEHVSQVKGRNADLQAVVLTASGNATLTIGPSLLQEAEEAIWQGLQPLLAGMSG